MPVHIFLMSIYIYIYIVTWYAIRERGKGRSIPLPLYLNQQALRLTVKMVGERRSSYLHSVTCSLLNERTLGQSSGVTRWGGGRRKLNDWPTGSSCQKDHHPLEKFEEEILVWTNPVSEADWWGQPAPGRSLTHKKERKKSERLKIRQR